MLIICKVVFNIFSSAAHGHLRSGLEGITNAFMRYFTSGSKWKNLVLFLEALKEKQNKVIFKQGIKTS